MARGHPDYNALDITFFSKVDPNADVIAEQSGFARLDNRGRVLWFDDFRQGLNRWNQQNGSGGTDPIHILSEELSIGYHGSIKLDCLVNSGISMIDTTLVLPVSKRLGVEVGLRLVANCGDVEINLSHSYSNAVTKTALFYVESGTGAIVIYDGFTRRTIFTPSSVGIILNSWITVKFVVDLETNTWVRCLLGNQQFELSQYALRNGTAGLQGYTEVILRNTGTTATLKEEWYCGYVIISGDEP